MTLTMTRTEAPTRTLASCANGETVCVTALANGESRLRLAEMGLTPGVEVLVERRAPFGDPIDCRVRGYHLSLRKTQAELIQVVAVTDDDEVRVTDPAAPIQGQEVELTGSPRIALLGNPNVGKTALFNQITGLRQRVANYPGVTVERAVGGVQLPNGTKATVVDLPGTYSLSPASLDERIASQVVFGLLPGEARPDVLCLVLDASNLARNLLLFSQAAELGLPMVVALNMMDIAKEQGVAVEPAVLERQLGVPVVPVVARSGQGILQLGEALAKPRIPGAQPWVECESVTAELQQRLRADGVATNLAAPLAEILVHGDGLRPLPTVAGDEALPVHIHRLRQDHPDFAIERIAQRYDWITRVLGDAQPATSATGPTRSERIDDVLLHPFGGLVIFGLTMWAMFALVYTVADPLMGIFEELFTTPGAWIGALLPEGPIRALWLDGIVAGVGGVLVFLPQIALLFLGLALLESSGYLARGAFLLDRVLVACGLHGKSFIPMLSSHACAIPGIMASRTISNHRDRLVTMLVAPLMVCGARLPVYALLIGFFFGQQSGFVQGSVLFGLYVFGIVSAVVIAKVLRATKLKGTSADFLMELPSYKWPGLGAVARVVGVNVGHFLKKAGTIILAFSVILWAALTYPGLPDEQVAAIAGEHEVTVATLAAEPTDDDTDAVLAARNEVKAAQTEYSFAGRAGKVIEPVVAPMGYDWKMGVGLIGAFAAREVFVSMMGVTYGAGEVEDDTGGLEEKMAADKRADGSAMWTIPVGLSLLVFFAIAMQCISTTAVMVRETGGWTWPLLQLAGFNVLAFVLATIVYQVGSLLL